MVPRKNRFVPIGVTGCPVGVSELAASRETRVSGEKPFRVSWREHVEPHLSQRSGQERPYFIVGLRKGLQRKRRCEKLPSLCGLSIMSSFPLDWALAVHLQSRVDGARSRWQENKRA